jgi:hypothetical protein
VLSILPAVMIYSLVLLHPLHYCYGYVTSRTSTALFDVHVTSTPLEGQSYYILLRTPARRITSSSQVESTTMGPCSPNPCDVGASCNPIQGEAFCRCPDEDEFYLLGDKPCNQPSGKNSASNDNPCLAGICGAGTKCLTILGIPHCECPNGEIVEHGKLDCSSTTVSTNTVTIKKLNGRIEHNKLQSSAVNDATTSCSPNPCASCMVVTHGAVRCGFPNNASSVPFGVPCPTSPAAAAFFQDYPDPLPNPFFYAVIALIGIVFMGCLLLCKFVEASTSERNERCLPRRKQVDNSTSSKNLLKDEYGSVDGSLRSNSTASTDEETVTA